MTGDERAAGYLAWTAAQLESLRGDADATRAALGEIEAHSGDWFVHATGAEFLADAADLLDPVGDPNWLGAIWSGRGNAPTRPAGVYPCRGRGPRPLGRPGRRAHRLGAARAHRACRRREPWRMVLLDAFAAPLRLGDPTRPRSRPGPSTSPALGTPGLPLVRERAVAERLLPLAARTDPGARPPGRARPRSRSSCSAASRSSAAARDPGAGGQATGAGQARRGSRAGVSCRRGDRGPLARRGDRRRAQGTAQRLATAGRRSWWARTSTAARRAPRGRRRPSNDAGRSPTTASPRTGARSPALRASCFPATATRPGQAPLRERVRLLHVELLDRLAEQVEARGSSTRRSASWNRRSGSIRTTSAATCSLPGSSRHRAGGPRQADARPRGGGDADPRAARAALAGQARSGPLSGSAVRRFLVSRGGGRVVR